MRNTLTRVCPVSSFAYRRALGITGSCSQGEGEHGLRDLRALHFCASSYSWAMSALMWWLIPIGATLAAIAFVIVRSRPSRPMQAEEGMDRLQRMQEAMERPLPGELPKNG